MEPESEIGIDELLDACDLHLVFLHPGIIGELKLKKKFGSVRPKTSPPEFPQWASDHMGTDSDNNEKEATTGNDSGTDAIEGFKNSTLLKAFLNIPDENMNGATNGGNVGTEPDQEVAL